MLAASVRPACRITFMSAPSSIRYRAFISYSHLDSSRAKWLHRQLERFRIDKDLVGVQTPIGPIPKTLRPVFRDRDEFTAGQTLNDQTRRALDDSAALVVLCSPASAQSHYVNEEVRLFKQRHSERAIIPVIIDGSPCEDEHDCFAPAIRREVDIDGVVSDRPADVVAADLREEGDGQELCVAKVIARLLGLPTDDVFRRAERERRRNRRIRTSVIALLTLLTVAATSSAVYAWHQLRTNEAFLNVTLKRATEIVNTAVDQAEKYNVPRRATRDLLSRAEALFDDMARLGRPTPELRHRKAWMLIEFARNYALLGDTDKQRARAFEAQHLLSQLSVENPTDKVYQYDLSFAHNEVGDLLVTRGKLAEALKAFRDSVAIRDRLVQAKPPDLGRQRDLSVSYNKVGDVLVAQGNLTGGLKTFLESLAIRERLAKAEPQNAGWQRDLATSHNKIGDVLVAQSNLSEALASFRASQIIFHQLSETEPKNSGRQRDLSVSYDKIGAVFAAQGNLSEALISFRASQEVFERLLETDPHNSSWRRDLSVAYNKIGDVLAAQGDLSEALNSLRASQAIFDRLSRSDPNNAGWQRDLSVSYNKIGDVLAAQGNLSEALKSFRASQAIFGHLVKVDPDNADWRRDLAVSNERIGAIEQGMQNNDAANGSFERALSIYEALLKENPDNPHILLSVTVPLMRLGSLNAERRTEYFSRALRILKVLNTSHRLDPDRRATMTWLEENLK
jgi:tetratricopeptide (TPR) repeat protein